MSQQFSRRWSGPANPPDRPGQKPGAPAPVAEIIPPDNKIADLKAARLAELAAIADRILDAPPADFDPAEHPILSLHWYGIPPAGERDAA